MVAMVVVDHIGGGCIGESPMVMVALVMLVVTLVMVRDKCLAVDRSAPDSESGARSCGRCDLIGGLHNKRQNTWHMEEY